MFVSKILRKKEIVLVTKIIFFIWNTRTKYFQTLSLIIVDIDGITREDQPNYQDC